MLPFPSPVALCLALPMVLRAAISSTLASCFNRAVGAPQAGAGPGSPAGARNFFELAVVAVVTRSRNWYRRSTVPGN